MPLILNPEVYRAVLESLPAAVYLVDRNRQILLWNTGAEKLTGYLRHEVLGRCCHDNLLMHCDENNTILCGVACPLAQTMHDGQPRDADVFLRHKDGQRVPVRVRAEPLRDEHGSIIGAVECFDERPNSPASDVHRHLGVHTVDGLTEMPDRQATLAGLQAALENYTASQIPFGILSIAIDDLDHLRHAKGCKAIDAVRYAAAQTVARNLRANDMVGRWSEDRFVAIVAECNAGGLLRCAERLKRMVSLTGVLWWGDRLSVTVSAGGTVVRTDDTPESLFSRAEQALQTSLQEHGDHVVVA